MSRQIEQVNELLKEKLGPLIAREVPLDNGLITIVYVKTTADLRYARVAVSVLPDSHSGTALKRLRALSGEFSRELKRETRLSRIPRFHWTADMTERDAAVIEEAIDEAMEDTGRTV